MRGQGGYRKAAALGVKMWAQHLPPSPNADKGGGG